MRSLVMMIVLLVLLAPGVALGGKGDGQGPGNGNGPANANANANSNGNGSGNGPGNGKGHGGGAATAPDKGLAGGAPNAESAPAESAIPLAPGTTDQDLALEAVKSGQALPLSEIVRRAVPRSGGRVIDARLVEVGSQLVYRLTVLTDSGVSQKIFVNAKTGVPLKVK